MSSYISCNSYIFKFYHKYSFLWGKTEKFKNAVSFISCGLFQGRKLSKKMTFVRKSYIQNLLKNRKPLPAETFWNILGFDKESKSKQLTLSSFFKSNNLYMTLGLQMSWFQKSSIQILWTFSINRYILGRL